MINQEISKKNTGLFVIDVQEKLFPHVDHPCDILDKMQLAIEGCQILGLPIIFSEQYTKGLGHTIASLRNLVPDDQIYLEKTSFSCLKDKSITDAIKNLPMKNWILMGLETHVCVLQTAKDLIRNGYHVIILNDATSSRSVYDFSTAIAELRDIGARVTSTETILFELTENSQDPKFKEISHIIKSRLVP